jgi:ABC transport system ATP-binding/permease protein
MVSGQWKCSGCGRENPQGIRRCRGCGNLAISPDAPTLSSAPNLADAATPPIGSEYELPKIKPKLPSQSHEPPTHWLVPGIGAHGEKPTPINSSGLSIGRVKLVNQLCLEGNDISRVHAHFQLQDGKLELEDCSANGTFVNGRRVGTVTLRHGDHIRFGMLPQNEFFYQNGTEVRAVAAAAASVASASVLHVSVTVPATEARTIRVRPEDETIIYYGSLQLVLDQYAVETFAIKNTRMVLGRSPGPDGIEVEHPSVIPEHAELSLKAGQGVVIKDLGSPAGTFVNGLRIREQALQEGDLIRLGECTGKVFLFRQARRRPLVLRDVELTKPLMTLGRADECDVHLAHPTVSRHHADVRRSASGIEIIDRGSNNGTFVNGERIRSRKLRPKDRLTLGSVQLVFDGTHFEQESDGSLVRLSARGLTRTLQNTETGRPQTLLHDVSLAIEPREFVALLGPGGAGKTTLLHALSGVRPADRGRVMLNTWSLYKNHHALRSVIGYVPQDDIVHLQLSVEECLWYAARLRLPGDHTEQEIESRIRAVLGVLELTDRKSVRISELSGGQRKRVSVAIELLGQPALLFLDEPTAGQDPRTEMRMMQSFREIANQGSSVILTTHLLASFSLLDKVAVMLQGRLAYFGPAMEMLPYFKVARPQDIYDKLRSSSPDEWETRYRQSSDFSQYVSDQVGEFRSASDNSSLVPSGGVEIASNQSLFRQLTLLARRQFRLKLDGWQNIALATGPVLAIALLVGAISSGPNHPRTILMLLFSGLWFGGSSAVREIVDERPIYRRERQRGLSIFAYLSSKLIYGGALAVVQSLLFVLLLTALEAQLNHFLQAWLMMALMTMEGVLIGLLISALARTPDRAMYLLPLVLIPQLLLAGLLMPIAKRHPFNLVKAGSTAQCTVAAAPTSGLCLEEAPVWSLQEEMPKALAVGVSPLMVSRWGLEGLSDLYSHDYESGDLAASRYSFENLGAVYVSLHPQDEQQARQRMQAIVAGKSLKDLPSGPESVFYEYCLILGGVAVMMSLLIAFALKIFDR